MKNIYTNIYSFNKNVLKKTVESQKRGNIAGLPTETVYGLAGNAYSEKAVKKIYKLKNRPKKNPLILHYLNLKDADYHTMIDLLAPIHTELRQNVQPKLLFTVLAFNFSMLLRGQNEFFARDCAFKHLPALKLHP